MVTLRMASVFASVLSLSLISSITTQITFENAESFGRSELFDRTVSEFSSFIWPLIASSLKDVQSSDILKKFSELGQLENGMDDFLSDFGTRIGVKNSLFNSRTTSESTINRSDSLSKFFKTMMKAAERLLVEQNIVDNMNTNVRILTATFNSLANENKDILKKVLSDVITELVQSYGIFQLEQFPDWPINYLDGMRSSVGNTDLYEIIPNILPSKEKYKPISDLESLYSYKMSSIKVPDKNHFKEEDSKFIPKTSSESTIEDIRSKRSIARKKKSKSLYSKLSDAVSSSAALSEILKIMASPEAKLNIADMFTTIETFLGDGNSQLYLDELREAINSTIDYLTPEEQIEVFANAMEQMLESTDRLKDGNSEEIFNSYVQKLKDTAESFDSSDSPSKRITELSLTIYSFMLDEEIAELENFRTLMTYLISEMFSLSGVSHSNTDLLISSVFGENEENSIIMD